MNFLPHCVLFCVNLVSDGCWIGKSVGCAEGYFGSMFPGLALGNESTGHSPIALGRRRGFFGSMQTCGWPSGQKGLIILVSQAYHEDLIR